MLSRLPDAISHHVGRDVRIRDDLEEAHAGLTAAVGLVVRFQNASSHPETLEDLGSFRIGPVENLGVPTHLDRRRWEKPEQPPGDRDDQRNAWGMRDIARFLQMPPRHHIEGQGMT